MQRLTRQIAFENRWDEERKEKVLRLFDELAPQWHTRGGAERLAPTRDALERGLLGGGGRALEIGSGTGIQTVVLKERFSHVASLDISPAMLALAPRGEGVSLVRGDAARLPLAARSVDAVVCVNAFLFPAEYARVLAPAGQVVFVSTSGDHTPIYLPPEEVAGALEGALGPVRAVAFQHGWATWTVVARAT